MEQNRKAISLAYFVFLCLVISVVAATGCGGPYSRLYLVNDTDSWVYVEHNGGRMRILEPRSTLDLGKNAKWPYDPPPQGEAAHEFTGFEFIIDSQNGQVTETLRNGQKVVGRIGERVIFSQSYSWEQLKERDWTIVIRNESAQLLNRG